MNNVFDGRMFKEKARAQVSNVILIFLIFIGINLILGYTMSGSPFRYFYYMIHDGSYVPYTSYKYLASGLLGTGLFSGALSFIIRTVEPYFETKACLYSKDHQAKVDISALFKSGSWDEFFSYFIKLLIANLIVGAVMAIGIICLVIALSTAISYSAYGMTMMSTRSYVQYHTGMGAGTMILLVLSVCATFGTLYMHYRYALVPFLALEEPKNGIIDTLKLSAASMKGYKWSLFVMDLSFIGWYFLVLITGGLVNIYVAPYHALATTEMYRAIVIHDNVQMKPEDQEPINAETTEKTAEEPASEGLEDHENESSSVMSFCPYCGTKLNDPTANFCPHCGKKLK